eukprot:2287551-Rhodomonas_salina.1
MMNVETQSSGRALWRTRVVAVLLLRGIVCCSAAQSALGRQHTDEDSNIICKAVEVIWDHVPENHGHEEGVTLASVASVDRALAVLHVSASWDDAVSIAMYARTDAEAIAIRSFILNTLAPYCESKGQLFHATLISSCTVKDSPDEVLSFPINKLRWHAVAAASTNIVLYVDVDFLPSKDASAMIRGAFNSGTVDRNEDLLILPCFVAKESSDWPIPLEIRDGGNGSLLINVDALTKPELHNRFLSKRVEMPGVPWSVSSQAATDYVQWFQVGIEPPALREDGGSASGYYIDYTAWYEPYFALDKSKWRGVRGAGMFDDRFEGWGGDKAGPIRPFLRVFQSPTRTVTCFQIANACPGVLTGFDGSCSSGVPLHGASVGVSRARPPARSELFQENLERAHSSSHHHLDSFLHADAAPPQMGSSAMSSSAAACAGSGRRFERGAGASGRKGATRSTCSARSRCCWSFLRG